MKIGFCEIGLRNSVFLFLGFVIEEGKISNWRVIFGFIGFLATGSVGFLGEEEE